MLLCPSEQAFPFKGFRNSVYSQHLQLPSAEEVDALLAERKLNCVVFFLDETFEELEYDITTTVVEAVEHLAGLIKLRNYSTFTLYESRKASTYAMPDLTTKPARFLEAHTAECIFPDASYYWKSLHNGLEAEVRSRAWYCLSKDLNLCQKHRCICI